MIESTFRVFICPFCGAEDPETVYELRRGGVIGCSNCVDWMEPDDAAYTYTEYSVEVKDYERLRED